MTASERFSRLAHMATVQDSRDHPGRVHEGRIPPPGVAAVYDVGSEICRLLEEILAEVRKS